MACQFVRVFWPYDVAAPVVCPCGRAPRPRGRLHAGMCRKVGKERQDLFFVPRPAGSFLYCRTSTTNPFDGMTTFSRWFCTCSVAPPFPTLLPP